MTKKIVFLTDTSADFGKMESIVFSTQNSSVDICTRQNIRFYSPTIFHSDLYIDFILKEVSINKIAVA